ncbi:hypothetical protein MJO28_011101 [Puccinia striiformis f. sp. tritici]|uniref:Uncharacterized protein n=1 Tax=Puccinia striiformis f. sp. tritici TaxID=168172 RepID=A0ACC0E1A5_9BASI|nr:hypothetical protein MJO28_011101 [Puccinia striiformis f. sp. tritici]
MNFTFLMMFIYLENLKTLSEGSLITSADHRLGKKGAEEIKEHVFFSGIDWSTIQNIEASFVPHLKLVTDTSYFPTDDLGDVPNEPVGADTDSGSKDLAFLGYTISKLLRLFSINE